MGNHQKRMVGHPGQLPAGGLPPSGRLDDLLKIS